MQTKTQAQKASTFHRKSLRRQVDATLRDTWVLIREFRDGVLLFVIFLVAGAAAFHWLWNRYYQDDPMRFFEAMFHVMGMMFLQPDIDFPPQPALDVFFFLMPLLGLIALARGLADFGILLFNRNSRQAQWEEAVAATYSNHIIIAGLGHLGIRIVRELVQLDEQIVVIESNAGSLQFDEARRYDIPIILGDARSPDVLNRAGLERATSFIIATNNDLANLQIASQVREINKEIRLVMRMFDDAFARSMADRFDISAVMSASMMAAPAFAGAATGTEIIQTFKVADKVLAMGRVEVQPGSALAGRRAHDVEHELDVSIVLVQNHEAVDVQPSPNTVLQVGDVIAIVAELHKIKEIAHRWNRVKR